MNIRIIACLLLACFNSFAQQINQHDSLNKKHGKWIVYLDNNWSKTEDSTKASFKRFTWYDHGVNIYPMGTSGGKGFKMDGKTDNKITLLDGEYKWFDAKRRLSSVHVFKNGVYQSCSEYFTDGSLSQVFDFTARCKNQEHGWKVTVYKKNGEINLESMTCKDEKGKWPKMRG